LTQSKYSIPPKVENRQRDLGKQEKKNALAIAGRGGETRSQKKEMILSERKHQRELRDVRKRTKSAKEQRQKKKQQLQ
jgi:hypothetical protein